MGNILESVNSKLAKPNVSTTTVTTQQPIVITAPPNQMNYQLTIKTLTDTKIVIFTVTVAPNSTVNDLKKEIQNKQRVPILMQRLIYIGKQLENEKELSFYDIPKEATLHLVLRKYNNSSKIKTSSNNPYDEITLAFIINGAHFKKYTFSKSTPVKEITKTIYNDFNLDKFGFPVYFWICEANGKYLPNNACPIGHYGINSGSSIAVIYGKWPKLPCRDSAFNKWLHSNNDVPVPEKIAYPLTLMIGQYREMEGNDRLRFAIVWLDVVVAEKLIESNVFDVNVKDDKSGQTLLNLLCQGHMYSNVLYNAHEEKWLKLIEIFCQHDDVDIETMDVFDRSPLANCVRNGKPKIANILLRYGAYINECVVKEIKEQNNGLWIYEMLDKLRKQYGDTLMTALSSYNFSMDQISITLDYFLCPYQY